MKTFYRKANVLHFHEVKNFKGQVIQKARKEIMPSTNAAKRRSRLMQKEGAKYVRG
jgi:hypothetical protein